MSAISYMDRGRLIVGRVVRVRCPPYPPTHPPPYPPTHPPTLPLILPLTYRDNEEAYVSLNDDICWTKTRILATNGKPECGGYFKEERFPVTGCYITLPPSPEAPVSLKVKVWTNLDGEANDESFAIDNVKITKEEAPINKGYTNKFDNKDEFEGWNCGSITTCGDHGHICGGFNSKGTGDNLIKTFMLPPGTYSVELDFVKIDSW